MVSSAVADFNIEKAARRPLKPLVDWKSDSTAEHFDLIANGFGSESTLLRGLVIDDQIYASPCKTSKANYP